MPVIKFAAGPANLLTIMANHQGWAELPGDLLTAVLLAAHGSDACFAPASTFPPAPSLAAVARFLHAVNTACKHWRGVSEAANVPLRVTLGGSPIKTMGGLPASVRCWLARRSLAALHFQTSNLNGCSPGEVQQLAPALLNSPEMQHASGSVLEEIAVRDFVCSRTLCSLLPRFPALRRVLLTGYLVDIDLAPLSQLPLLEVLQLNTEALPKLNCLPATLRHLSVSCIANSARLSLPEHLELDSLVVHCPGQAVYVGLDRVMANCTRVHITAERINMLLHVEEDALHSRQSAESMLLRSFQRHTKVQHLVLETWAKDSLVVSLNTPSPVHGQGRRACTLRRFDLLAEAKGATSNGGSPCLMAEVLPGTSLSNGKDSNSALLVISKAARTAGQPGASATRLQPAAAAAAQ